MSVRSVAVGSVALLLCAGAGIWLYRERVFSGSSAGAATSSQSVAAEPTPVTVVIAKSGTVPRIIAGIAVVAATQSVTVQPRIDGEVTQIAFAEGDFVKAGDVLAKLDSRALQASLEAALAKKAQDLALLDNARGDLQRYTSLADKKVVSSQDLDSKKAAAAQLDATVQADEALIRSARAELSYATIRAPIGGRTGFRSVSVGSVVGPSSQNGLVTITQMDPISVVFVALGDRFGEIQQAMTDGVAEVDAIATDGTRVLAKGKLDLMDNIVNAANGSIRLRATFDNGSGALWPGLPVATRLTVARISGLVVPDKALARGVDGLSAYVIGSDETAAKHPVEVSVTTDGLAVVSKGLSENDRIVFDGLGQIADGGKVHVLGPGLIAPPPDQAVAASGSAGGNKL